MTISQEVDDDDEYSASVEICRFDSEEVVDVLPPLSCGHTRGSAAIPITKSHSERGQVLLIGGYDADDMESSAVHKRLIWRQATEASTSSPFTLRRSAPGLHSCALARRARRVRRTQRWWRLRWNGASAGAARASDVDRGGGYELAEWRRYLPNMSIGRDNGRSCVLGDGRFAVFGGWNGTFTARRSCEVLTLDADGERWEPLPPMHDARMSFACAAVGGCVIFAGGWCGLVTTTEVYEEALGRWRRLPCNLPHEGRLSIAWIGAGLM